MCIKACQVFCSYSISSLDVFVNAVLDCGFAWVYTDRLRGFRVCCIFVLEKINTSFVELPLIHFS